MKTVEFSTITKLPASPEEVFSHLADPNNHVGLSPLVVAVDNIRRESDKVHFTATERFTLGPLRYNNVIAVTMGLGAETISGEVVSPGGVRLTYGYRVDAAPGGTKLVDHYRLSAPFGLLRFSVSQAKKVQAARSLELLQRFEKNRSY
ncbi:SRPBCC family protein [Streptomyces sp. NPDC093509]|uniref:SRPBCC family protein n=1 Tax=Streptomyces sp. NPDC093509 TaxID=3154982 RepID=UPI00344B78F6